MVTVHVPLQKIMRNAPGASFRFTVVAFSGASLIYIFWKWLGQGETSINTKGKRKLPPGLVNTGNTCFMNVLLQSFASTSGFVSWMETFSSLVESDNDRTYLANNLLEITEILNGNGSGMSFYDASSLLQAMAGRGWQISSQEQDTHEFFHAVITTLTDEYFHVCKGTAVMDLASVSDLFDMTMKTSYHDTGTLPPNSKLTLRNCPFRGSLASMLCCQTCGHKNSIKCDAFDSLSIPIGATLSCNITLMDCLEKFVSSEVIHDVNCDNCGRAQSNPASNRDSIDPSRTKLRYGSVMTLLPTFQETVCFNTDEIRNEWSTLGKPCKKRRCYGTDDKSLLYPYHKHFIHFKNDNLLRPSTNGFTSRIRANVPIKRTFRRCLYLAKLPECLCIHLQRLIWIGGNPLKMTNFVQFPETLDVTSFTYSGRLFQNESSSKSKVTTAACCPDIRGDIQTPLTTSYLAPHRNAKLYHLTAVIVHVGDWSSSGHFFGYRKCVGQDGNSTWIFTSDTVVRKATRKEVFSCPAYMLIYERVSLQDK